MHLASYCVWVDVKFWMFIAMENQSLCSKLRRRSSATKLAPFIAASVAEEGARAPKMAPKTEPTPVRKSWKSPATRPSWQLKWMYFSAAIT